MKMVLRSYHVLWETIYYRLEYDLNISTYSISTFFVFCTNATFLGLSSDFIGQLFFLIGKYLPVSYLATFNVIQLKLMRGK